MKFSYKKLKIVYRGYFLFYIVKGEYHTLSEIIQI